MMTDRAGYDGRQPLLAVPSPLLADGPADLADADDGGGYSHFGMFGCRVEDQTADELATAVASGGESEVSNLLLQDGS